MEGTIKKISTIGLVVNIKNTTKFGIIHKSEIDVSKYNITKFKQGETIYSEIIEILEDRIRLSLKNVDPFSAK